MYYLIKFGYDGSMFSGFQRGNGSNSVEDSIIRILEKYEISNNIESAARTDRYVSAKGNVMLINTEKNIASVMGILNARIPYMFFYSYAIMKDYFNPRHNSMKKYSYIITGKIDIKQLMETLNEFVGQHDFKNFCRVDSRNTVRTVNSINYTMHNGFYIINIYGKSFVWHQIRSMMAFALMGNRHPFSTGSKFTYLADPTPLTLIDISYDNVDFMAFDFRRHKHYLSRIENSVKIRYMLYESFSGNLDDDKENATG
jgi:tRNA pseudouridine38-40 synthase